MSTNYSNLRSNFHTLIGSWGNCLDGFHTDNMTDNSINMEDLERTTARENWTSPVTLSWPYQILPLSKVNTSSLKSVLNWSKTTTKMDVHYDVTTQTTIHHNH